MAITFNADTTNGAVITSDTSGEINFQSAGSTITSITANGMAVDTNTLYVDATNNRVGIGTSSPSEKFHVSDTSTSTVKSRIQASTGYVDIGMGGNSGVFDTTASDGIRLRLSGNDAVSISSSGNVTIGTANSTSGGTQYYAGTSNSFWGNWVTSTVTKNQWTFNNPNGEVGRITTNGTSTSFLTSSDYRLKENVVPMSGSINRLKQLKPSTWAWIHGGNGEGFLAHEAQEVVPEAVSGTKDEVNDEGNPVYQGIDQSKLVPLLTAALQEAITKIEDLETRIQALESV